MGERSPAAKVGLIGFGTLGRAVAEAVRAGRAGPTELVAVLVRDASRRSAEAARLGVPFTTDWQEFAASGMDVVVELAGHAALRRYAEPALAAGKDLVAVSVGAFADEAFHLRVRRLAAERGRRVVVPSGAIAGLDAVAAAALAEVAEVTHTTRKHPRAFTPEQLGGAQPAEVGAPLLLYDGPAREGVGRFPENVNVAAAVALAGVGLDRTRLRVVADPGVERNTHEVEVRGWFGRLRLVMENTPTDNPKTGRIVALSVVRALRDLSAPLVVGA